MKKRLIIVVIQIFMIQLLSAQTVINKDTTKQNRAYVRVGIEPNTVVTFGYQHNFDLGLQNQKVTSYAEWGTSITRFAWNNSELKIGGIIVLYDKGNFNIVNNFNLSVGSVTTQNFNSKKFAIANEVAFGIYKSKWFAATTIEYENICRNHIEHTEFYKTTYYEDAKDGWYKGGGGMFQFGLEGGIAIKDKYDIYLEIKAPFTEKFNNYGGSPFHINLGTGFRF